ncbi:hypothetical protein [uncultured Pseudomonas sp.]|uniref:hypothetical protein n=1 Tax=uncultured Pseudomonas sp. TaxID=114707 RepID=UPI00258D6C14|nr:hypothetical protein [uncultured Pseudomonas sp.]
MIWFGLYIDGSAILRKPFFAWKWLGVSEGIDCLLIRWRAPSNKIEGWGAGVGDVECVAKTMACWSLAINKCQSPALVFGMVKGAGEFLCGCFFLVFGCRVLNICINCFFECLKIFVGLLQYCFLVSMVLKVFD